MTPNAEKPRLRALCTKLKQWPQHLLHSLLPNRCQLCPSQTPHLLCESCYHALPHLSAHCSCCALPLPQDGLCPECLKHLPCFDKARVAFEYRYPLDTLILDFKHRNRAATGRKLALALLQKIKAEDKQTIDLITCVPLHWRRHVKRGYNQAEIIANALHTHGNLARDCQFVPNLLLKHSATISQQNLTRSQRKKNLSQSITVCPSRLEFVAGKRIAIVDDVITTGATADVAAYHLKQAGATYVEIWALARTPKSSK